MLRRNFLKQSGTSLGLLTLPGLSSLPAEVKKLKVICLGAHPDDPESGCGGTLLKFSNAGHDVTIIYLTRGEAGISGKSHQEAATIRTEEAQKACMILKANALFAGQIDGDTVVNNEAATHIQHLLEELKPDLVFTHWPLDAHRDHQAASMLVTQTWFAMQQRFALYYFEVCAGEQTVLFHPTDYVDITAEQQEKKSAVFSHESQDPASIYACGHTAMEEFRGREAGVSAAEAFIRMKSVDRMME